MIGNQNYKLKHQKLQVGALIRKYKSKYYFLLSTQLVNGFKPISYFKPIRYFFAPHPNKNSGSAPEHNDAIWYHVEKSVTFSSRSENHKTSIIIKKK